MSTHSPNLSTYTTLVITQSNKTAASTNILKPHNDNIDIGRYIEMQRTTVHAFNAVRKR